MSTSGARYVFGAFSLTADGRLLTRDGAAVRLAPKALRTLLVLTRRAGEVVSKNELMQAVWPDTFVEESGLARNISALRSALGDEGVGLIATVARVGYRFAGELRFVEGADVERPVAMEGMSRGPDSRSEPLVGHARELGVLREALARAHAGRGGLIAMSGEAGIGKTTLVETAMAADGGAARIARGRCSEQLAGAEPHLPVLEALQALAADDEAMARTLRSAAPTWASHVLPADAAAAHASGPRSDTPQRLLRELTTFLEAVSRATTVVLFLDDLHWADAATVDVLAHVAGRLARHRVLIVLTYRERELLVNRHPLARVRGDLIARGELQEHRVQLLTEPDVSEYVEASFEGGAVPDDVARLVFDRSEGNPLFMRELVRYIRLHGVSADVTSASRDLPGSLRALMERIVDETGDPTREALSAVALRGPEFETSTIAAALGLDAVDVEERIRAGEQVHGVVRFVAERELPDGTPTLVYRFVHVLFQEAFLERLTPSRRSSWARRLAASLRDSHSASTDAIAGTLARLFEIGRDFAEASAWFLATSRNAMRLFAFASAIDLADRGLACLDAAPMDERLRRERRLALLFARLVPSATLQGYAAPDVVSRTQELTALAEEVGDVTAHAAALGATWFVRMVGGQCVAARDAGRRLAALGRSVDDNVLVINGEMHAQIACHHLAEFGDAARHAATVASLAGSTPPERRCVSVLEPVVSSLAESSRNRWITGQLRGAVQDCEATMTLARSLRHPGSLSFGWLFHAWLHGYRGDWTTCEASSAQGLDVARQSGTVQTLAWNTSVHGWADAHLGNRDRGARELAAGIEASIGIMGEVALPQFHAMTAEVHLLGGDVDAALAALRRADDVAESNDDRYFSAEIRRLVAACRLATGQAGEAGRVLHDAVDLAAAQGAVMFELRAALDLSSLDPGRGPLAVASALARLPEPEDWPEVRAARRVIGAVASV